MLMLNVSVYYIMSVSYTHLDVYKRQGMGRIFRALSGYVKPMISARPIDEGIFAG